MLSNSSVDGAEGVGDVVMMIVRDSDIAADRDRDGDRSDMAGYWVLWP